MTNIEYRHVLWLDRKEIEKKEKHMKSVGTPRTSHIVLLQHDLTFIFFTMPSTMVRLNASHKSAYTS